MRLLGDTARGDGRGRCWVGQRATDHHGRVRLASKDDATWLTPGVSSGSGSATVTFTVTANTGTSVRSAQLTIGGVVVNVTQQGSCNYTVAPTTVTVAATAGSSSVTITTTSGCTWQVSDNATWLTPGVSSGSGSGTVTFSVTANPSSSPRTAQLTIAGIAVNVTQQGACVYTVTPPTITLGAGAGSSSVQVTTAAGCTWQVSDNASWLTPGVSSGSGPGTVSFSVTANTGASVRSAQLTVAGIAVTVSQQGTCAYNVTPTTITLTPEAGSSSISVTTTSGCAWQVSDNATWLTPDVSSGSGNGTVTFSVTANPTVSPRSAQIAAAGFTVNVTQQGIPTTEGDGDGDGIPDSWEEVFGLDPTNSGDGTTDPDGDGVASRDEYLRGTHPRGFYTRYFAEGASNGFFHTKFALLHPGPGTARVLMRFLKSDGSRASHEFHLHGQRRMTLDASDVIGLGVADFSTIIESDSLIVADRTMSWDARGFGSHAETSIGAPSLTWYLAEGATHGGFDLFYLLQNPNTMDTHGTHPVSASVEPAIGKDVYRRRAEPQDDLGRSGRHPGRLGESATRGHRCLGVHRRDRRRTHHRRAGHVLLAWRGGVRRRPRERGRHPAFDAMVLRRRRDRTVLRFVSAAGQSRQ